MNKITLRQIINGINKNSLSDPDIEDLCTEFELYYSDISSFYEQINERLKAYYYQTHRCTDTQVGSKAYYLDDELVAISHKPFRKTNEYFQFASKEAANKVRDFFKSFIQDPEIHYNLFDLDKYVYDEKYAIDYNCGILHRFGWYNGEKVKIVRTNFDSEGIGSPYYFHGVEIKLADGTTKIVTTSDLLFDYNTLD
jgi:hypothetical protein